MVLEEENGIFLTMNNRKNSHCAFSEMPKENSTRAPSSSEPSLESLDDCGLRFLLAKKQYIYLKHCLPMAQRKNLQKQGMSKKSSRPTLCIIKIPEFLISRIEQFKSDLGIPFRK